MYINLSFLNDKMIGIIYLNWLCKYKMECFKLEDNTVMYNVNRTEKGHLSWRESRRNDVSSYLQSIQ